ncbi:MAG: universal stress protein [Pedobacter sp.]|nr:MAG: universal stress protein [Pedobacter sp.]
MKNILIPTDFSVSAENAAQYGVMLAKALNANITLCNVYKVPSEAPMAAQVAWPLMDEAELENESESGLTQLVAKISKDNCSSEDCFCPEISFESEKGNVCKVVKELVKRKKIELVIMGTAGAGKIVQWALGSNSKTMIDEANFPVMYIPYVAKYKTIKKIAFTTNLSVDDLEPLQYLSRFAAQLDAEIIVYHITNFEAERNEKLEGLNKLFFEEVVSKIENKKIVFENIWHSDVSEGLKFIRNNKEIDVVAMVHRQHNLLDKLINGSYVHKFSRFTNVPLLVFQPSRKISE